MARFPTNSRRTGVCPSRARPIRPTFAPETALPRGGVKKSKSHKVIKVLAKPLPIFTKSHLFVMKSLPRVSHLCHPVSRRDRSGEVGHSPLPSVVPSRRLIGVSASTAHDASFPIIRSRPLAKKISIPRKKRVDTMDASFTLRPAVTAEVARDAKPERARRAGGTGDPLVWGEDSAGRNGESDSSPSGDREPQGDRELVIDPQDQATFQA
jgi:hypothetical protein